MMRRTLVIALLTLAGTATGDAWAHQEVGEGGAFAFGVFPPGTGDLRWYFESGMPGSATGPSKAKQAVLRGDDRWNWLGQSVRLADTGYQEVPWSGTYDTARQTWHPEHDRYCQQPKDDPTTPEHDPKPLNLVFWESLGSLVYGEALNCLRTYPDGRVEPTSFLMALGCCTQRAWYMGEDLRVPGRFGDPDAKMDLQGVATHEFGHALGFFWHYDDADPDGIDQGGAKCSRHNKSRETMCARPAEGEYWWRSLGSHDKHTFNRAY